MAKFLSAICWQAIFICYLARAAVLVALDGFSNNRGRLLGLDLGDGLGPFVLSTSGVHLRTRVLHDASGQLAVTCHFELSPENGLNRKTGISHRATFSPEWSKNYIV